ncbi:FAD-dependent oxidoreductase [Iodobacter sp. LRB]|uniref:FAD-dependent oxidoreductase n=1 Tax=unclassified Iodobacter TaxID=235634 RepID=UPI000C0EF62A|nr:FAD-dependent oxidoreductase [Iodobacter sp. BJB302]PHV03613.1 FAD-dependent oxidoreductase [Iodobacter sp. BJB302]
MSEYRPWWFEQALIKENPPAAAPLRQDLQADVCIVGGGYTGLWTAISLKTAKPELSVVMIEKDLCGSGASGRNGGCLLTLATKFLTLKRLFGEAEALRIVKASEDAVYQIAQFCRDHQIDAEVRVDGTLYTATNTAQLGSMDGVMNELARHRASTWVGLPGHEVKLMAGSDLHIAGAFSPVGGSVQPGLLVRGLARVARAMGVQIFEATPMERLIESARPVVVTAHGKISAGSVVLALNASMATLFPALSRSIAVVSSDMIITEPCPDLLQRTGLTRGVAVCDSRIFVNYYRSTADGRLMLGKGGNTFSYGNRMLAAFDKPSAYQQSLTHTLRRFFPALQDVAIAASWNGPSDRSVTGIPFFGRLNQHPHIFYGFGYSGNGVGPAYLGGQVLSSLVLDADNEWTRSPLVTGPRGFFPPEPIRWLGANMVRNAIRRKENAEDKGAQPWLLDCKLAGFAAAAGKSDKA